MALDAALAADELSSGQRARARVGQIGTAARAAAAAGKAQQEEQREQSAMTRHWTHAIRWPGSAVIIVDFVGAPDRVGLAYRFDAGGDFDGIALVLKSLFER
jgi:hypothetical protein